uniref:Uncharacterized protein n=1 Tax=viral metagenome TaxID=1070528 RepID=A0A6C0DYY9_9ZZZZ
MFSFNTPQHVIINDRYPAQVIDCPPPRHFTPGIISRMYLIKDIDNIYISGREHDVNEIIKIIENNKTHIKWDDDQYYFDAIINGIGSSQTTKLTHPKIVRKIYGKTSACITDIGNSSNEISITGKEYVVDKIFQLLIRENFKPDKKDDSDFFNAFLNAESSVKSTAITSITPKKIYSGSGTTIFLKKDDKYYLVLIKELKTDLWEAFGGKIDRKKMDELKNAIKETYEESRRVFDIINDHSFLSVDVKTPQNDLYKNYIIVIEYLDFEKIKKMFVENIVSYILADERRKKEDNESYYETSAINFVEYKNLQDMIKENKNKCASLDGNIVIGNRTIEVMKEIFKQHHNISRTPIHKCKSHHNKIIITNN